MMMRKFGMPLIASATVMVGGCAALTEQFDGYPADTAILIGDVAYQINTTKCAVIKGIGEDGALDCHDSEGRRSASITPVSDWRRNLTKEKFGFEWASPEHQAFLFYMIRQGGTEKAVGSVMGTAQQLAGALAAAKSTSDSIKKSREIEGQGAQMRVQGAGVYFSGGMPAWQAHQQKSVEWRLDNARFFLNQANKSNLVSIPISIPVPAAAPASAPGAIQN